MSLQYVHDGSDTLEDSFTLVGRTASKTSAPAAVRVRIIPVNDETPRVVNNTGLELYVGSTRPITTAQLGECAFHFCSWHYRRT